MAADSEGWAWHVNRDVLWKHLDAMSVSMGAPICRKVL